MTASGHAPTSGSKQAKSSKRGSGGGGGQAGSNPSAGLGLAVPPGYPHMAAAHQYQGQQLGAGQVTRAAPTSGQRAAPAPGAMATMQQYNAINQYNHAAMLYAQQYAAYDNRGMGGYPHPGYPASYYR